VRLAHPILSPRILDRPDRTKTAIALSKYDIDHSAGTCGSTFKKVIAVARHVPAHVTSQSHSVISISLFDIVRIILCCLSESSTDEAVMAVPPYNVLFLCNGNSARSIMAEAILNKLGAGKFQAYSAGSRPEGHVHPETLRLLQSLDYETTRFRSKPWNEFGKPGACALDFVFTVCDTSAGEACPVWPGRAMSAQWSIPDPAAPRAIPPRSPWRSRTPIACFITGSAFSSHCR
jgi:protein-tyrosine-phosphatase